MKARLPETAGRRPGPAGRSGPASFSGPSSRTKAGDAAGAGAFVSGALGAALLAAAALLLHLFAPGEARAVSECGSAIHLPITCTDTSYPDGIFYGGSDDNNHPRGNGPINVAGSSTATTTITSTSRMVVSGGTTTTSPSVGIYVYGLGGSRQWNDLNVGVTVDSMGEMTDAGHVVNIVQGTSTNNAADRNNGIYFQHRSQMGDSTVRVGRGVTIGSETTPMQQNGIFHHPRGLSSWGGGKATLISAATIFAAKRGIWLYRDPSNVYHPSFRRTSHTTITNSGAIRSGEEGIYLYFARPAGGATHLGDATITNTGAITVSGAKYGIFMDYRGYGATEIDNAGNVAAAAGSGIHLAHNNNGTVTLTNSGDVDAATVGLRLEKRSGTGAVEFTNSGAVTVTADAAAGAGHALWLTEGAGVTGAVTITNRGVLRSKNHALYAEMSAANAAALTLTNSGAVASADGDGIRLARGVEGDVAVTNSADVSGRDYGVYVGKAARIDFDQTAGTISGRTGVYAEVSSASASGDTRSTDSDGNHDPAIDVDWTGGSIARGTAENDNGRFRAASATQVLSFDQESATVKAVAGSARWGAAAGIEAHALSWRDVAEEVAKGDDPGAFADNAAQLTAVPTGATVGDNAYVKQLRAALGNADLAVAAAVFEAIDPGSSGPPVVPAATSLADLTDAEIVTYLQTDNAATRTLLRNVLAQGLSDDEKAILRAVAAGDGDGVDAALTAAGFTDDTSDPNDYWSLVKALLDRYNIDDIRIAMTAGSIDSRGDGIRAYYATQHDSNGGISVTVAAGATVTGGTAGIYVANAGPDLMLARKYTYGYAMGDTADELVAVTYGEGADAVALRNQLVTVAGTVTGGTDAAVRLSGGGAVIVVEGGKVHAGASGVGILADGPALVYVDGEVRGGEGGAAAVHLSGGGIVTVGPNGRVQANGAGHAIRGGDDATTMVALTLVTDRLVPYREDVNAQVDGSLAGVENVVRLREDRDGVPTGYSTSLAVTADGRLDTSKLPPRPASIIDCAADGPCRITQAETISDRRTGVYAAVPRASESGETRAAADQPLIDVTWTGTFSHAEGSSDEGRFTAETVGEALVFDRESAAVKAQEAPEGSVRYGGAAGIEAHALSWRDVAEQVAKGDDPDAIANKAAQDALLATSGAASRRTAILAQFKAALGNADLAVAAAVLTAIDSTATTVADLSDTEIVTYLGTNDAATRALLRNVLAQGLSDKEKAVLRAVATDTGLDDALNDADAGFTDDYKTEVKALLDRYNVGDVRVNMTGGSIDSRGDGIRAYYATPHDMNGGIRVDVAAGTTVTGAMAGIYVANAGPGLMLEKKYTPGYAPGDAPDELVAVTHGEGANEVPLLNQLVTVAGMVTGGTDAAVHLSGGGAVIVMEGGKVHAGSSGVAILVNDPGPALVYIASGGEVKGGAGGAAAVHLTGGGSVIVGLNGKVEANGATNAIQGGDTDETMVALTLATGATAYRDVVDAQVEGSLEGVSEVRLREYRDGAPTGYSPPGTVTVTDGKLDTSGLPLQPCPDGQLRDAEGECPPPPGDTDVRIYFPGGVGGMESRDDGIRAWYPTPNDDNGGISVTVPAGASVTGSETGVYVANAGEGLRIPKRYAPYAIRELEANKAAGENDLIAMGGLNAAGDAIETPYLNQLVTVAGTVTGGTDAAVHLSGGGAVIVMAGGKVYAGSSGVAIKVNDPGPAYLYIDGEVKGKVPAEGEAPAPAAVHLTGGGSVIVGLNGKVEANGAARAIRGGGTDETMVALTLVTDGIITHREDAEEAYARVEGSTEDIEGDVRFREDRDGVPTGYSRTLPVADNGMLDTSGLDPRPKPCPDGQERVDGECPSPSGSGDDGPGDGSGTGTGLDYDMDGIRVVTTEGGYNFSDHDGYRVSYAAEDDGNGGISVTVAAGTTVTGSGAGIYVANAGTGLMLEKKYTEEYSEGDDPDELVAVMHGEGADKVPLRNQLVTVAGTVTGGRDAAVHLNGGGAVIVMEGGEVHAGDAGVAIKVNDPGPAVVYIDGEVKGRADGAAAVHLTGGGSVIVGLNGSVKANGAAHAIRGGGDEATMVALTLVTDGMIENPEDAEAAYARVEGSLADVDKVRFRQDRDGVPTGYDKTLPVDDNGMLDTSKLRPGMGLSCEDVENEGDRRCRLYEALPSMLLAMNALPSYAERTSAARDANGGWARVEAARGEWQAKKAETATMGGGKLAYDHRRNAVRAGVDFLAGESARVGVSVHALRGKAEMGGVGEVELDGMGGGLSATWLVGGLYVDAQAAVTLYDVDVESNMFGKMPKKDVYGAGYGLGVDVGRRMSVGGMFVTPRAGVGWSKVDLDDFTDMERYGGPRARVSVEEAVSVKGRLGVMVEMEVGSGGTSGQVFGSLDVEGEFSDETEVKVGGQMLKTEVRPTAVRLGLGGEFAVDEDVVVRGTAGYRTSGSGTSGYGGGLELRVRF